VRKWTLIILAPGPWISANGRYGRFERVRLTLSWRSAIEECCRTSNLPHGPGQWLDYFSIDGVARFRGRAPVRDRDNLQPTLKAAIDGLTPERRVTRNGIPRRVPGWGLIPDDSDKHMAHASITIGEALQRTTQADHPGLLYLTITELARPGALF
jgi:hypothetical protein